MLELDTAGDVLAIAGIAAGVGAFAALTAELIVSRGETRQQGIFELPGGSGNRFVDLGSLAAIPIGILAAVIAAFLFAPGEEQVVDGETERLVQLGDLLLISAAAGLSGTAFLAAIQERFAAVLKTKQAEVQIQGAIAGLLQIKETAADTEKAQKAAEGQKEKVRRRLEESQNRKPPLISGMRAAFPSADPTLIEIIDQPDEPLTENQLADQADELVSSVVDSAAESMSDQVVGEVDLLLKTLDPQGVLGPGGRA